MKNKIFNMIRPNIGKVINHAMYVVNVDDVMYSACPILRKVFRDIPEVVSTTNSSLIDGTLDINYSADFKNGGQKDCFTIYHGTPITLYTVMQKNVTNRTYPVCFMKTLRTKRNVDNLHEFIDKITRLGVKEQEKSWGKTSVVHKLNRPIISFNVTKHFRTFDDIFITAEKENAIKSSLDRFINNREWYIKNGIPYHFGILLYGPAGTGKTSIAQAIAKYTNSYTDFIYGDDVLDLPDMLGGAIQTDTMSDHSYRTIIIEDIDCGLIPKQRYYGNNNNNDDKKNIGFASLLNSLDGINAPTNTIYVFTTNHIEKLDPALIRPGRIDLKLEIDGISRETFDKFCMHHYGKTYDGEINFKPDITFAKLQTDVVLGKTIEELVEVVRNENT